MHVVYSFKLGHTIPLCARTTEDVSIALLRWQADFWLLTLYYYTCPREWAQEFPGVDTQKCSLWSQLHQVVALQGSGMLLFSHWPAPTTCSGCILSDFCYIFLFLMWVKIPFVQRLAYTVSFVVSNCSYSLAIFLLNCFAVFLVGNFNIRNLGPLCKCTLLMSPPRLILSLCLWGSCHLENFNFILSNFPSFWYNVYVLSLILSQKLSLCWCHKDSLSCFLATVFWFCFSH